MRMHPDQVEVTETLVRGLLQRQHPRYADLPLAPVAEHGTDHALYRLGEELVVRLPVYSGSAGQSLSDARWLPVLAPHLPVAVPAPLALGEPDPAYPFAWSIAPWLPGRPPTAGVEPPRLARELGAFVRALHAVDPAGGPRATGTSRGVPLRRLDPYVRAAGSRLDRSEVLAAWEDCLAAPDWEGDPVWIHGDLMPGNLLVDEDRLTAVIDWGALGTGDPAPDLMPAWSTLAPEARTEFRDAVGYDDDTWRRGRGWALAPAVTGIPYYWDTVPEFARRGLHTVAVVLDDLGLA